MVTLLADSQSTSAEALNWWQGAVVYQIYPRSFADTSGDGVGDLRGVIQHLDYLEWLGLDAIWLSPIFRSPMADFGYDISDHCAIDPLFGTLQDAQDLIDEAHRRDLRVLFDVVLGHTSDQHPWFQQSRSGRSSRFRDWYVWRDGPTPGRAEGGPPNNWVAGFPAGAAAWTFDELTRQWYLHSHLPEQPDLNWENPAVADAQERVLRFWLDRGVDGVRLDSINRLGKDPDLRDNVAGLPLRQQDWPSVHPRLQRVRRVLDEYPGRMAVGEVWLFEQRQLVPYLAENELHLAHNFVFARSDFGASQLAAILQEFAALAPDPARAAWFLNNHDEPRTRSRFDGDDGCGLARAELLAVLLLTLPGTVFLYQGEELGMADTPIPAALCVDRDGRDPYPYRTPMPWLAPQVAGAGAGFTTGHPWLPVGPDADRVNVAAEQTDAGSTLHLYRQLIRTRRATRPTTRLHDIRLVGQDILVLHQETVTGVQVTVLTFAITPGFVPAELVGTPRRFVLSSDRSRSHLPSAASGLDVGPLEGLVVHVDPSER
jgi:alpha-glucosidase